MADEKAYMLSNHDEIDEQEGEGEDAGQLKFETGEVADILKEIYSSKLQEASNISERFQKTMEYCDRFNRYKNPDALNGVLEQLQTQNLHKFELVQLGNILAETAEEAKALIPSLNSGVPGIRESEISDADLDSLLQDIANDTSPGDFLKVISSLPHDFYADFLRPNLAEQLI